MDARCQAGTSAGLIGRDLFFYTFSYVQSFYIFSSLTDFSLGFQVPNRIFFDRFFHVTSLAHGPPPKSAASNENQTLWSSIRQAMLFY